MLCGEMALRPAETKRCFFQPAQKAREANGRGGSPALPADEKRTMLAAGCWGGGAIDCFGGGQACQGVRGRTLLPSARPSWATTTLYLPTRGRSCRLANGKEQEQAKNMANATREARLDSAIGFFFYLPDVYAAHRPPGRALPAPCRTLFTPGSCCFSFTLSLVGVPLITIAPSLGPPHHAAGHGDPSACSRGALAVHYGHRNHSKTETEVLYTQRLERSGKRKCSSNGLPKGVYGCATRCGKSKCRSRKQTHELITLQWSLQNRAFSC